MQSTATVPLSALELCDAMRHGLPYDPARLDRVLRHDTDRGLVEAQAAAPWKSIAAQLGPRYEKALGERMRLVPVGKSIARNAAGPDGRPAVTHVESLTLVTPAGELRQVRRSTHAELFALAIGGQGLFGALYSVTLRTDTLARAIAETVPVDTLALETTGERSRPLQVLVPPEKLARFVDKTRERCAEWRTAIGRAEARRTLPEEETALRWSAREYALITLQLAERDTLGGSVRSTQLRRELIDAAIDCGGSFPIACTPEATREHAEACYPQLGKILAEKRRLDPEDKLCNPWYLHHRSLLCREALAPRWNS